MKPIYTQKRARGVDPDIAGSEAAMLRAATRAHERALRFGHTVVIFEEGKMKEITPQVVAKQNAKTHRSKSAPTARTTATGRSQRKKRPRA